MSDPAEAHGRPVEALAKDIVAMYPDEELAKTYIARKAMIDLQWKLDEEGSGRMR